MNLEWFWIQMAEQGSSIVLPILVGSIAVAIILASARQTGLKTSDLEKREWQLRVINQFYHVGMTADRSYEFRFRIRNRPKQQAEYLDVYLLVGDPDRSPIVVSVEVSRYKRAENAILVKHAGTEKYFPFNGPGSEDEALVYFRKVLRDMART